MRSYVVPNNKTALLDFENALGRAVAAAAVAFESSAETFTRAKYLDVSKGAHVEAGGIYAFYDAKGSCLYVGESGMALRKREAKHPSPLSAEEWWPEWRTVLVLNEESRARRELLERLLVLALSPRHMRHKQTRNVR